MTDFRVSPLSAPPHQDELRQLDAYFRAANYLTAGQIYLMDNPLLQRPLVPEDIKPRLLGHWGTSPGLNFLYAHLSRSIKARGIDAIFVCGPGHGGPAVVANTWLEGTYSERFPHIARNGEGMGRLFRQFSFPGGIPSHCSPDTPGSIHEGGELGYSLSHAFGAAFDNPDLVVACVVGDGEAETGPAATGWHSNKFLDPRRDGVVLPILHLNGYKIAAPTILDRIPTSELLSLFAGHGYRPVLVEGGFDGEEPMDVHRRMASALDGALAEIGEIQDSARGGGVRTRPVWPMLILRTPKGWTGPKLVDGLPIEGTFRRPPASAGRGPLQPRASGPTRGLASELPTRGAFRRGRGPGRGDSRVSPGRRSADERQPARQRGPPAPRSGAPRLL